MYLLPVEDPPRLEGPGQIAAIRSDHAIGLAVKEVVGDPVVILAGEPLGGDSQALVIQVSELVDPGAGIRISGAPEGLDEGVPVPVLSDLQKGLALLRGHDEVDLFDPPSVLRRQFLELPVLAGGWRSCQEQERGGDHQDPRGPPTRPAQRDQEHRAQV